MREISIALNALSQRVIGSGIEVHRALGPGYLERIYEEAFAIELSLCGIRFERQYPVAVMYKGHPCGEGVLDFLIEGQLVAELKAVDKLIKLHEAQVLSYLKVTGLELGLLLNFQAVMLKDGIQRVIRSSDQN